YHTTAVGDMDTRGVLIAGGAEVITSRRKRRHIRVCICARGSGRILSPFLRHRRSLLQEERGNQCQRWPETQPCCCFHEMPPGLDGHFNVHAAALRQHFRDRKHGLVAGASTSSSANVAAEATVAQLASDIVAETSQLGEREREIAAAEAKTKIFSRPV